MRSALNRREGRREFAFGLFTGAVWLLVLFIFALWGGRDISNKSFSTYATIQNITQNKSYVSVSANRIHVSKKYTYQVSFAYMGEEYLEDVDVSLLLCNGSKQIGDKVRIRFGDNWKDGDNIILASSYFLFWAGIMYEISFLICSIMMLYSSLQFKNGSFHLAKSTKLDDKWYLIPLSIFGCGIIWMAIIETGLWDIFDAMFFL